MLSVFSPLAGGNDFGAFDRAPESPLRARGEDFTRPQHAFSLMPFPVVLGYVSGFAAQQNALEFQMMRGKTPFGSWVGAHPETPEQLSFVFPDLMGGLQKVKG